MTPEPQQPSPMSPSFQHLMPVTERPAQVFVRGQGSWLWDSDDRAYLDFSQGCAANTHPVNPAVLVETVVLGCQNGLLHYDRHFRNVHGASSFLAKLTYQYAICR